MDLQEMLCLEEEYKIASKVPNFKIIPQIQEILDKLPKGHIVGGFVRDSIIGIEPKDIDIITSALPSKIKKLFPKHSSLGEKFGTIIIKEKGLEVEVTTMRRDMTPDRHPNVSFTDDIYEDLSRRDFTMNAMAINSNLELIDPFNGRFHIANKMIKTVGSSIIRLYEDPFRAFRAIRFSSQLDFKIHPSLKEAIKQTSLIEIPPDAIRKEFLRSLDYNPVKTISEMIELNLIGYIDSTITSLQDCQHSPTYHPEGNALNHTYQALTFPNTTPIQKMAILFHDIGKTKFSSKHARYNPIHYPGHAEKGTKHTKKILKALKFSNKDTQEILFAIENHMKMHNIKEMRKSKRYNLYLNPNFQTLLVVHQADVYKRNDGSINFIYEDVTKFISEDKPKEILKPLIDGNFLLSIGFPPSKELRKAKEELYNLQINQNFQKEELEEIAKILLKE